MNSEKIGAELKRLREENGKSMRWVASRAGVSVTYIKKIESGEGNPTINVIERIARVFDLEIALIDSQRAAKEKEISDASVNLKSAIDRFVEAL